MLPDGLKVNIEKGTWPVLPIFELLRGLGNMEDRDIYNTFNMGIGLVMAVDGQKAEEITAYLKSAGEAAYIIGTVTEGETGVEIICLK